MKDRFDQEEEEEKWREFIKKLDKVLTKLLEKEEKEEV